MNKNDDREEFIRRRCNAIQAFVVGNDLGCAIRFFRDYGQPIPKDLDVLRLGLLWMAQEIDLPEAVKRRASMKCLAMGFPDHMPEGGVK